MFNKMIACKSCGAEIAKSANRCPYCGARQHTGAYVACVLIIVFTFIACAAIIGSSNSNSVPTSKITSDMTDDEKAAVLLSDASSYFEKGKYIAALDICQQITFEYPTTQTAGTVGQFVSDQLGKYPSFSSTYLMSEYVDNVVNADKEYNNQIVIVYGTISDFAKTNNDKNLVVLLESGHYFQAVQLNFSKEQEASVAMLQKGDTVKAIGKCTGLSGKVLLVIDGTNVMIENCYIL